MFKVKEQIYVKTAEEINSIRQSGDILSRLHGELSKRIEVGVKTIDLDQFAESFIKDSGSIPSFKGYRGFPFTLCISVNDVVVHGFPSHYQLKDGDVVSIDCGVNHGGFHADSAYTYRVGNVSSEIHDLMNRTYSALLKGIDKCRVGNRIGDISSEIQRYSESFGYGIVRELVGHGVGKNLHEAPEVPNYGKAGQGPKLMNGMVIAIEPMVTLGRRNVKQDRDGWSIRAVDGKPAAHYEHTVAVVDGKPLCLTSFDYIIESQKVANYG